MNFEVMLAGGAFVVQLAVLGGLLWKVAGGIADLRFKVDQMWEWFQATQIRGIRDGERTP